MWLIIFMNSFSMFFQVTFFWAAVITEWALVRFLFFMNRQGSRKCGCSGCSCTHTFFRRALCTHKHTLKCVNIKKFHHKSKEFNFLQPQLLISYVTPEYFQVKTDVAAATLDSYFHRPWLCRSNFFAISFRPLELGISRRQSLICRKVQHQLYMLG